MSRHSLSWSRTFRIWWSIGFQSFLNTFFFWIVIGLPVGFLIRGLGWVGRDAAEVIGLIATLLVYAASMLWGVRLALEKEYRDFRLDVVELVDPRLR